MTEKRFTSNNGVFYIDKYTGWEFQSYGEVVNLLNNLNDENQQLRKLIEKNKTRTDKAIKELVDTNVYLKKENEQLKQSIDRLINKYRNAMTDEPSTVNWYCNHIISDLKKLKELGDME